MQPERAYPLTDAGSDDGTSLDLEAFAATPLQQDPFDYIVVPGFLRSSSLPRIVTDFPRIDRGGSYPADSLACGPAFARLLGELQGPDITAAFEQKFGIDLAGRPTMVTLRGKARAKDGRVHTDSDSKLITALIYLNSDWDVEGGRLRLLRDPHNLEDFVAEVPPDAGTLLAFRCTQRAYHGHKPFVGQRRSIQLNWVTDPKVLRREMRRHGLSAWTKRLQRLISGPRNEG